MSDYLTDDEQIARLKTWWEQNGRLLIAAIIVGIGGLVGWRWYDSSQAEQIADASNLYADYLDTTGEAQDRFAEELAQRFPDSSYQALVLLNQAAAAAAVEDFETAEVHLNSALDAADTGELEDLIRVRLARVLQQRDQTDAALSMLAAVRSEGYRPLVAELKGDIHLSRGERALAHEAYVSALEDLEDGTQRPLLELKVADTADAVDS